MQESAIQPILCCVGQSVAGRPTQFLMERAFEDCGLDWRAITVQVAASQFEDAVRGMRAMKFSAIRFFDSLPSGALDSLCGDRLQRFVGEVTSAAYRQADSAWEVWHNSGYGLLETLGQHCSPTECTFLLSGDSVQTRSLFAAAHTHGLGAQVHWSAAPHETPLCDLDGVKVGAPKALPALSDGGIEDAIREISRPGESVGPPLVLVGEEWGNLQAVLGALTDQFQVILIGSELSERPFDAGFTVIPRIDCLVAAEAYDFARWTGRIADLVVMREAYEEYCDF